MKLSGKFYRAVKWVKIALLLTLNLFIVLVDYQEYKDISRQAIEENKRDLQIVWDSLAGDGLDLDHLPPKGQQAWETMDVYAVDPVTKAFLTPPRLDPWRQNWRNLTCDTQVVRNAQAGLCSQTLDGNYQGDGCISIGGPVDGTILIVEMCEEEAHKVSVVWYHFSRSIVVCFFSIIIVSVVWLVHRDRDQKDEEHKKFVLASAEIIRINEDLNKRVDELEAAQCCHHNDSKPFNFTSKDGAG